MPSHSRILAVVVQSNAGLDAESEMYRYLMKASLLWEDKYEVKVITEKLDMQTMKAQVAGLDSKYVVFMESSHLITPEYLETMLEYLEANTVFLAEPKIYTGALPSKVVIKENDKDYYYSRDTDIYGVAFNTRRLSQILDIFGDLETYAIYTVYRLYWGIENHAPLPVGYSVSTVTKVANGLAISPSVARMLPTIATRSFELRLYVLRLVILFLRGARQNKVTGVPLLHLKEVINFYALEELTSYSEVLHSFETGFLSWISDTTREKYLYKQLTDNDVYLVFKNSQALTDETPLYSLTFGDSTINIGKAYLPKTERPSYNNPKSYDFYSHPITPESTIIFFDRPMQADDNAEHLYAYFLEKHPEYTNTYFALNPKSKDWDRLLAAGFNLIPFFGEEFYEKFLISDLVVSSQIYTLNYRGKTLANSRFVYLQHGVQLNDMTDWVLSKYFDVFIATGKVEADYLGALAPRETLNSGLPRFETLAKKVEHAEHLLFMPTWRFNLQNSSVEQFMESDYFKAINGVLTDPRLLSYLEQTDRRLLVQLHPNTAKRLDCFEFSERVQPSELSYSDAIASAEFIFTDYSSAVIDGAFVGIPIAYYQWDIESFFADQPYAARLSYEDDAMGPLFTEHQEIIDYIVDEKYKEINEEFERRRAVFFEGVELSKINSTVVERMLSL